MLSKIGRRDKLVPRMPPYDEDPADDGSIENEDADEEEVNESDVNEEDPEAWDPSWTVLRSPVDKRRLDVEAVRELIEGAEVDTGTGEVIIWVREIDGVNIPRRLRTLDQMRAVLSECGWEEELDAEARRYGILARSGMIFTIDARQPVSPDAVDEAIDTSEAEFLFQRDVVVTPHPALYQIDSGLVVPATKIELANVNEELIRYLARHPKSLYVLEPRRFEELVAEIFRDFGYEVLLTPRSNDGGVDIRAVRKDSVGTLLYLIECKRYRQDRAVGVDLVRSLYGVIQAEGASCGVLATTSRFTKGAQEFARRFRFQLSLRDYTHVVAWLEEYLNRRKR
jgi:HJR/Mrr/RecB family endonuclease